MRTGFSGTTERLRFSSVRYAWLALYLVASTGSGDPLLPEPPSKLVVMAYNTANYGVADTKTPKSSDSVRALTSSIGAVDPDIAVLSEIGSEAALRTLVADLAKGGTPYEFVSMVEGDDANRHLAVIAKVANAEVRHDTTSTYRIRDRTMRVRRGFAHCVFQWSNGYRLHVIGGHLKSKVFHPLGQTDMRRYEARQLRYLVVAIQKEEPGSNILVLGDMNDTPDSSPVTTLISRRSNAENELYDLRPRDATGLVWTHFWADQDTYSRIDYALAGYHLLPEIDFERTVIPAFSDWRLASDHRPVVVTIVPEEKDDDPAIIESFERNFRK